MSELEIRSQPRLSIRELVGMSVTTQRHRLFRSLVTILVVTVATAFLVNLGLTALVSRNLAESASEELRSLRGPLNTVEELRMAEIEKAFNSGEARRILAGILNTQPDSVDMARAWELFAGEDFADRQVRLLESVETVLGHQLDREALAGTARYALRIKQLEEALAVVSSSGLYDEGAAFRLVLLLGVSLLVCIVGVANALLMSVTERSREIATLKCLGALDGAILSLFVLEASIIGLIGGLAGALLGLVLSALRLLAGHGVLALGFLEFRVVSSAILISILLGIALATLASVYPSLRAARLAPMEAMRVE